MIFPRGFTGFGDPKDYRIPVTDPRVFKSVCFAVARELGGRVVRVEFADVTPSFHCITLEWGREPTQVSILCNRHYWIVGCCKPRPMGSCTNEYVDAPELASALHRFSDWQVLSRADLEAVVDETALAGMHPIDRRVIETARRKRWFSPTRTVGDVLFHYWD